MNPRQGPSGRMHHIRETSWGDDPTTPNAYLIPFISDGMNWRQPRTRGVYYDGIQSSKGSYKELIDSSGPIGTSLDYHYVGVDLMDILGSTGYTRVGGYHKWVGMGPVLPHQIRKEYTQATAIIRRRPGVVATMMEIAAAVSGQQQYTMTRLGKGGQSLADIDGTVLIDNTIKDVNSYFDMSLEQDGVAIGNTSEFSMSIDRHVTRKEGVAQGGQAAAFNVGLPEIKGTLGKIFSVDDGDTFYNLGLNDTSVALRCLWGNNPLTAGPTMFIRFTLASVLFDANDVPVGGENIPDQVQGFIAQQPASTLYHRASAIGTVLGPYTFGASNVVSVKFDGGATIDVVIAAGSKSAAVVAGLLNADATFAAAGTAYDLNGRLEIRTDSTLVGGSVQWQTGTANSAHTLLGFSSTTFTNSAPTDIIVELFNDVTADYV